MCETLTKILSSIEFWKITLPTIIAIVAWYYNEYSKRKWERWQLKKNACLKALNIANAIISNYKYTDQEKKPLEVIPQYESIENVRSCFNELACTCDKEAVLTELKKIMFTDPPVSPNAIVNLRNAVRKELNQRKIIDTDEERAFIGNINCIDKTQ